MDTGIAAELQGVDLGDQRLNARSLKVIEALSKDPQASVMVPSRAGATRRPPIVCWTTGTSRRKKFSSLIVRRRRNACGPSRWF